MGEWKDKLLNEIATYTTGKLNSNAEVENGAYPFFTCSPITLRIDNYAFDTEALILAGNNANGVFSLKYYNGKFNAYQRTYVISIKDLERTDYKFLYYALKIQLSNLEVISHGTATKYLTLPLLNQIPILLPFLPEQKAIASVLSSLDDKIDLLHRQNKTLEAMAETLFRQWFVDSDYSCKVSDLIEIQNGYAFKSKDFKDVGVNGVIKIRNISGNIVDIYNCDFIEKLVANQTDSRFVIKTGDILFAMTGAKIGKMGIVLQTERKLWLNQRVGLLKEKYNGSRFLAYLQLKSDFGQNYIDNTATGSAQPNISVIEIENCEFPKITANQIKEYSEKLLCLYEKVIFNLGQIRTLEKLRDTLLPKLMSGEVRVRYNEKENCSHEK